MTTKETVAAAKEDEGARSFAVALQAIDEGCLHAEASEELQKLVVHLQDHAIRYGRDAKGELVLKIGVAVSASGLALVAGEVVTKTPKRAKRGSAFWLTAGGNLTPENPKQQKLPLRDVNGNRGPVREVGGDAPQEARGV